MRIVVTSGAVYALACLWSVWGPCLVPQLLALSGVVLLLSILGEAAAQDLRFAVWLLRRGDERQAGDGRGLA